ncbi:MAG TPA: phosphate ABC transporter substrate-binding protein [Opitutae bacterium]|nr:phosphate ABC transporter substrate-binding protein [Opitutae bacterium]
MKATKSFLYRYQAVRRLWLLPAFLGGWLCVTSAYERPNVLWIFVEDLSPFMGCYGDPVNQSSTPNLDRLAGQGVLFERAYATASVCSASRSAIITGVMQTSTGTHQHRSSRTVEGVIVPENLRIYLPEGMQTIPELMREAGYFTFNSGKDDYNFHYNRHELYSVGTAHDYEPSMNGWQGNKATHSTTHRVPESAWTRDVWDSRPSNEQPWFGQIMLWGGKAGNRYTPKSALLQADAVPLPPYFPDTATYREAWTNHYNAVRGVDAQVGDILAELEADGELDQTVIFFFSDHGSNTSLRHKQFLYEGGVHIPLIIAGGHEWIESGKVFDGLVSSLDISATTLALGHASMPNYLDGENLLSHEFKGHSYVFSARDRCDYTIDAIRSARSESFRYIRNYHPERSRLQAQYRDHLPIVTEMKRLHSEGKLTDYQAAHWFGKRPLEELYDLSKDPHQVENLAADPRYTCVLEAHRLALGDWLLASGDKGLAPEDLTQLRATYELWKDRPIFRDADINPEYDAFLPVP